MFIEYTKDIRFDFKNAVILLRGGIITRDMIPSTEKYIVIKDTSYALACKVLKHSDIDVYDSNKWITVISGDVESLKSIYTRCNEKPECIGFKATQVVIDEITPKEVIESKVDVEPITDEQIEEVPEDEGFEVDNIPDEDSTEEAEEIKEETTEPELEESSVVVEANNSEDSIKVIAEGQIKEVHPAPYTTIPVNKKKHNHH